ncbi:hypothetical protein FE236_09850 [Mariprofundus erugo]|uniref:Flagellar assembly protein FliX n=1 Tax=Mariprofundus erugo TaxID=2528639 RepID=A0A5R9GVJ6_9PROT|nr:hypothetical protein [Mariprofundus erugo]TLS68965.1 hypothetical protein FEF65_00225 [Mariprofundus erugo]TLS75259.1 hypothetical protein FE236_09850 [Mariprofundus erugo]
MKIQNNLPITGKQTRKVSSGRTDGVFQSLFEAEVNDVRPVTDEPAREERQEAEFAWKTLQESVSLLDRAMQHLESGDAPSQQLLDDIEQLRSRLHQQLPPGADSKALSQAETLLAVEAQRIRSLQG